MQAIILRHFPLNSCGGSLSRHATLDSLVLDPFGGAGTTALVALQLGHRAITIECHKAFTDEARERLSNAPARCDTADTLQPMELAAD